MDITRTNQNTTTNILSNGVKSLNFSNSKNNFNKISSNLNSSNLKKKQFNFFLFTDKFINLLMRDGKKTKAAKLFFDMLIFLKKRIEKDTDKKLSLVKHFTHDISVLHLLSQAVENVTPSLEVRKVRVSGTTYLVPAILRKKRQQTTAIRWIIDSARKKQNNSNLCFSECLADEFFDAYKKQGQARQKRDELHRLAEANRAYIRYRWW